MNFAQVIFSACMLSLLCFPAAQPNSRLQQPAAKTPAAQAKQESASAPAPFTEDKGRFRIVVAGTPAGRESFEISRSGANWVARGTSEVNARGVTTHVTGVLTMAADGAPLRYDWTTQSAKKASAVVTFSGTSPTGTTATINLRLEGAKPFTQQFFFKTPRVVILDNNLYHQYELLARMYDWNKKGVQNMAVLIPQEMTPGSVAVESLGTKQVGKSNMEELRVRSEDLEIDLYLDNGRLGRVVAPGSNAEAVRE